MAQVRRLNKHDEYVQKKITKDDTKVLQRQAKTSCDWLYGGWLHGGPKK